jgi:hypothetical protein
VTYDELPKWGKDLYTQTSARAKKRGDGFYLSREDYAFIFSDRCALTGIKFVTERPKEKFARRPFAASIDRIDSKKGYEVDNCRLVCIAVNLAMNVWGEDVLYMIAAGLTDNQEGWRKGVNMLPKGVKISYVTKGGPTYIGSRTIDGKRLYTRRFKSVADVQKAMEKLSKVPNTSHGVLS